MILLITVYFLFFSLKDDWKIFIVHHVERRTLQNGNKKLDTYYYFGCKNFESGCVCVTDNLSIQFFLLYIYPLSIRCMSCVPSKSCTYCLLCFYLFYKFI